MNLKQLFEDILFECDLKPLFEQILREMAELASDTMADFIDGFYYEVTHVINFRKITEPFNPKDFHFEDIIRKTYEAHCGEEFLTFIEPPEEDEWIRQVIVKLRDKQNYVSEYHRNQYIGSIDYIEKNNLLRTILDEIKIEYQQNQQV